MAATTRVKRLRAVALAVGVAVAGWLTYETIHAGSDVPLQPGGTAMTRLSRGTANGKRIDGKSWSLDYENATMTPDGSTTEIDDVHDGVLLRNGKPYMRMHAKHVSANIGASDFIVRGPVTFDQVSGERRRLETIGAHYSGYNQTLTLDHPTTIHQGPMTVTVRTVKIDFRTGATAFGRMKGTM